MTSAEELMASFWGSSDYGVLAPLTDAAVQDAEAQLGVRLPASLVRLLRIQNGGTVANRWNAFPMPVSTSGLDHYVSLDQLMGIGPSGDAISMLDTPYLVEEWGLPTPIVLLNGDGHWWAGLDYRDCGPQGEPSVAFFDADEETSVLLAPDFETFLAGLTAR
ncbi:SMI1/KNR4 family protein [Nocardia sp. NPDC049149]|uniref:SMI1/KNR4 family protein n=1 Tax=Nocardia sp. NPDC049149 TaxID=3364315 RepID=UPI003717FF36